jgi:threonine dehydratase
MRSFIAAHAEAIEGAAGVALAAMLARKSDIAGQNVAVIICGGNVSQQVIDQVQR